MNPSTVLQLINEINRINLRTIDINHLKQKIVQLFRGYAHTRMNIIPGEAIFYRSIPYSHKPQTTDRLSYPNPKKVKVSLRRANLEDQPVFYCSKDPRPTFFELELSPGDTVVLSEWHLTSDIWVSNIGYTSEVFTRLGSDRYCPNLTPSDQRHPREASRSNIRIEEFLKEKFTEHVAPGNEHLYKLTAVIAGNLLTPDPENIFKLGLMYPSLAMHGNADNYALNPDLADKHLQIKRAWWLKVDEANPTENFYTYSLLEYADSFSGDQINWRSFSSQEQEALGQHFNATPVALD
ncbi:MAG: hypothetical protein ACHQAX_09285 [Gammaproteobacteria bacterium]